MKKILSIILLLLSLSSCSMSYEYIKVDNYGFGYSTKGERAFIAEVEYNIGDDNNIILPETYNDYPIKELGGYTGRGYPCPFYIDILDLKEMEESSNASFIYSNMAEVNERIANGEEFEYFDIILNVTLPSKLEEIANSRANAVYTLEYMNGEKLSKPVAYRVLFNFTISENNKYFYTIDGKLYNKKNNELIEEFEYK